jgi:acetyl-CoA carboxylase carboxyl transferase subunit alpha
VLVELGIVDGTIEEPQGGAHRDVPMMSERIKTYLIDQLDTLEQFPLEELLAKRYERLMSYGN